MAAEGATVAELLGLLEDMAACCIALTRLRFDVRRCSIVAVPYSNSGRRSRDR